MGWNRPSENGEANSRSLQKRSGDRFPIRGAIAGAIVVIGAAVAAWWLWRDDGMTRRDVASTKQGLIKDVKPAVGRTGGTQKVERVVSEIEKRYGKRVVNGVVVLPPWEGHDRNVYTAGTHRTKSATDIAFTESADKQIADLLLIQPGDGIIGDDDAAAYKNFDKRFLKSLVTPIIVSPDDPPGIQELKRAVRDAKIDLKSRLDAGEDIAEIMTETRRQYRELGLYRQELEKQVKEALKDGSLSPDEMEDYVKAANKMLADRGAKEIRCPEILRRRLELKMRRQQGK